MKTIQLFFCGALLLFIGSASLSAQTNLIPNGGFETLDANGKPIGWYDWDDQTTGAHLSLYNSVSTSDFKEGKQSGYFGPNLEWKRESTYPYLPSRYYDIPVKLGIDHKYKVSFWYKAGSKFNPTWDTYSMETGLSFKNIEASTPDDVSMKLSAPLDVIEGEWFFKEIEDIYSEKRYETGADVSTFEFSVYGLNCEFWLDDVQMVETTGTGIADVKADTKLPVYVSDGTLYVGGTTAGETVSVYNITGQALKSETAQSATTKITGLSGGQVYIVRSGGKSAKVVL